MERKVKAVMIVEIAGRPAEYLKESLKAHVDQINKIKEVCVLSVNLSEPKLIESEPNPNQNQPQIKQEMYTCFAEVEFETTNLSKLIEIVFDYMPSSIEILEPENLDFRLHEATAFLNDLAGRLHKYDEIAKISQLQTQQLAAKMQYLQQFIAQKAVKVESNIKPEKTKKETKKSKKKNKK